MDLVQKMMAGGGGGMGSMLSGIAGGGNSGSGTGGGTGLGGFNTDQELARHVQQNAGIEDPEQARQYTQHGFDILNEQSNNKPQGLQSILDGFLGGGESGKHTNSRDAGIADMFCI